MPSLKTIRAANSSHPKTSPTAVFVGATSGIGLGTLESLLQNTTAPRIFIIGRNQAHFTPTLTHLHQKNPNAHLTFLEAQDSLLSEVQKTCLTIKSQTSHLDSLWLSQGGLAQGTHALTSEGLNRDLAICYYSRALFIHLLLPLLDQAPGGEARIVSVLSPGHEGNLFASDLGLTEPRDYGVFPTMKHSVTLTSLAMHELANRHPSVAFLHTNPGMVSTQVHERWLSTLTGPGKWLGWLVSWTLLPCFRLLGYTPAEAGEVGFYELSCEEFGAGKGGNFFRLSEKGEVLESGGLLGGYVGEGWGGKVWEHTRQVFEEVLG